MQLFDIGANLTHSAFAHDLPQTVQRNWLNKSCEPNRETSSAVVARQNGHGIGTATPLPPPISITPRRHRKRHANS